MLKIPKGDTTRPTSAKLRGSIFDILQNQIEGKSFLDLFAGSGSMGIEALSRGASLAFFVEKDRAAIHCIKENLTSLQIEATVLQMDAASAVKRLIREGKQFDLIYIDPPYSLSIAPLLGELPPLLAPEGIIILEQSKRAIISASGFNILDVRNFGDTAVYFIGA
ncbi:MAG: 16S rRNA (guanine(966)-N(2))-methyltransferase RsmD [Verrucomicrobia bacterium]|nr:16S rRNA (guanine(966)-N(2))-methyltransferase RsmD [Verrucomicrobiota bacterium]